MESFFSVFYLSGKKLENEILIQNSEQLKDKIYLIRGVQVMLDSDLAEIYGYSTKAFNQQIKNNLEKFDEDFMFQLTKEEYDSILRSSCNYSPQKIYKNRHYPLFKEIQM